MRFSKILLLIFLIPFAACKRHGYTILTTERNEGRSEKQYVEGSILAGSNSGDTILYYKFDLLTDAAIVRENNELNLGIIYSRVKQDSSYSINLGFETVPKKLKFDTIKISNAGNRKIFTNYSNGSQGKRTETAVGFINDIYFTPGTAISLTNEKKMKEFLSFFNNEIISAVNNTDTVVYSSVCYLDGYFQHINMTVTFK